ncbi:response regulator transcription factor [Lagierella sp.]|uniref:response regulator transcription factor n=1 Tax=Lagierella sp. TaxID=2849657 RepID=UPI002603751F|nr:response regulator transcription factor [Lagierella sp.]
MKIFIVEDEKKIADELVFQLQTWGYETGTVKDFKNVIEEFKEEKYDLVLMDLKLPYKNGFLLCEEIRSFSNVPIIFLTSAGDDINLINAINYGGDDFLAKPFQMQILSSKIKAQLRRAYTFNKNLSSQIKHRDVVLDLDSMTIAYEGCEVSLSKNEYLILEILMENIGKVVTRALIMDKLWSTDSYIDDNTLTVNVTRLRKKLSDIGIEDFVETKKGVGYIIR